MNWLRVPDSALTVRLCCCCCTKATAAQVGVTQSFCLARGGPPGMMATSAASGDPTAPPEGRVVASGGDRQREGGVDMSF